MVPVLLVSLACASAPAAFAQALDVPQPSSGIPQPSLSQALTSGSTVPLPQPVVDFLKTLDQIHVDQNLPILNDIKSLTQDAVGQGINLNNVSNPNDLWTQLNAWITLHTGVSMNQIATAAANVALWALSAIANLIKTGLQNLPGH